MTTIPGGAELAELAARAAAACGVDLDAVAGDQETTSPVNGERLASVAWRDAAGGRRGGRAGRHAPSSSGARCPRRPAVRWSSGSASCSPSTRTTSPR